MTDNIITQVSQDNNFDSIPQPYDETSAIDYNSKIHLNIRGISFTITRDELMNLPESILLCLFPNGVFLDSRGQVITNLTEEDIVYVGFDPQCFQYITDTFNDAHLELDRLSSISPQSTGMKYSNDALHVLNTKPAIIVLREDLDYYVVPPIPGLNEESMRFLKIEVSKHLLKSTFVFSGLGYDVHSPQSEASLGPAEKHLFEMLCSSGFDPTSLWGSRSMEPSKCLLLSLSLVRLKNHPDPTPPESPNLVPVTSNASTTSRSRSRIASLANSASRAASRSLSRKRNDHSNNNKLLLFWKKPARKCWWSHESVDIPITAPHLFPNYGEKSMTVKVHMRRVWTLELSVVGVQ
ncbi:hypothetical protein PSN45_000224 [Yamadazyma tenuis]|uniref:Growth regulation protein n=1 Tax=Candida tenuis (strain ATCC 10573 / BCRC 21748 / CBS 615 / JCM 9827 / NBRC 10315 / NRRL Y-1498 / VKM Y-70) TaxID=590646 RepID=G3BBI3_CANTC|nr:uncharacterized protein CANTEDRAFT_115015 [Yamadazyma tenuis ATCC 10573]EGV61546.1 hypothetical protein CANTEDRAFT_115015 [Yamadazyma tenuis ATCC 10573]WEJ92768.1 hypothetical protein PSN45_000224 [Yamadazyma tenuis]